MRTREMGLIARGVLAAVFVMSVGWPVGTGAVEGSPTAPATSVKEIFAQLPLRFNAEAAKGMDAVIQYHLTGEQHGDYYIVIKAGTCQVVEGTHPSPNMTETMAGTDYVDMTNGRLNGQMAFMSGKLKIAGDMGLAMKMQSLFPRPTDAAKPMAAPSGQSRE